MSFLERKLVMSKTRHKLGFVRFLYVFISFFRKLIGKNDHIKVEREGVHWELDLNEAIDFCLYLTGEYEPELVEAYLPLIESRPLTILDIGANIGAHTLTMAKNCPANTKIFAIEPTQYAFGKLVKNLEHNPALNQKVKAERVLLTDGAKQTSLKRVSASWDIRKKISDSTRNEFDGGFECSIKGAKTMSLDEFVEQNQIEQVDLIKLDVDGNEIDVLKGAKATLEKFRPGILVELSPIHFDSHPYQFDDLVRELKKLDYEFQDVFGEQIELETQKLEKWIPHGTLVNVLGTPRL